MIDLPWKPVLLAHGFSMDTCNELTVIGFPDGHDGLLLDAAELAGLKVDDLLALGERRLQVLRAILGLLHSAGWKTYSDAPGEFELETGYRLSSSVTLGFGLTFWLQRESTIEVLRRFLEGLVPPTDLADEAALHAALASSSSVTIVAPGTSSSVNAEDSPEPFTRESDLLSTPEENGAAAAAAWMLPTRVASVRPETKVKLEEKLRRALQSARSQIQETHYIWLGTSRLWTAEDDDWIAKATLIDAAAARLEQWVFLGHAELLMRFCPDTYRSEVHQLILLEMQGKFVEQDRSTLGLGAHFLGDSDIADWVVTPFPQRGFIAAAANVGQRNALYATWWKLHKLAKNGPSYPPDWLWEAKRLCEDAGWNHLRQLIDGPLLTTLEERLRRTLDHLQTEPDRWTQLEDAVLFALAIGSRAIGDTLVNQPLWQSALLRQESFRKSLYSFSILKTSILALSLLVPGAALRHLIEQADELGYIDPPAQGAESLSHALAVAWIRCRRAEDLSSIKVACN